MSKIFQILLFTSIIFAGCKSEENNSNGLTENETIGSKSTNKYGNYYFTTLVVDQDGTWYVFPSEIKENHEFENPQLENLIITDAEIDYINSTSSNTFSIKSKTVSWFDNYEKAILAREKLIR